MEFISRRSFKKQRKQFLQTNDELHQDIELPTKIIDHVKQTDKIMMEDEKDVLAGEYRKSPVFSGYYIFTPPAHIKRYTDGAIFRIHETKKDDPIRAATNLFGNMINTSPFEDVKRRTCRLILAHVLMQVKCCLFPVILSSFYRGGRRHYIKAVKMFDRNPSMLYTMTVKSLIHC